MNTSYRRSIHRARSYRGERTFGGCLVYAGENLLGKHLFVHRVSPGGFDWGPDAEDDRACQLAIALLAPTFGLEVAVDDHHLFATNFVKCELTGDSWTVRSQDLKQRNLRTKFAHREYPDQGGSWARRGSIRGGNRTITRRSGQRGSWLADHPNRSHQDIVDERRKALHALGYDVKFRWQIASDRYSIINPQEAYLPIVDALEHRGETEAFGWASYRDWGGLLKLFVVCPGLEQTVTEGETSDLDTDTEGLTAVSEMDDTDLVVYGGFETGYDFRGTQTLWAKPILYFPETGAVVPDTGKRYTRRHYGRATDAAHERANDRVPITGWWTSIYDDIDLRMVEVEQTIRRARAIAYDFETLPFSTVDCYRYWGIAETYASVAADRATTLAEPASRPTVYNLQLSLLLALLDEYEGSWASNTHQEYLEVAGELLRTPAMMIQLAVKEHDRQTDEPTERVLDEDQQTLSDALEDIVDIPGIDVDTEAALSDEQAQRLHDQIQRELGGSEETLQPVTDVRNEI